MTYNMDGSDFYKLANKFKKTFQEHYSKVKQSNDAEEARNAAVDQNRQPTLDEQTQFAHNIYMIKSEELGEVITSSTSAALDKMDPEKDELEITIDSIDPKTFHLLDRMIRLSRQAKKPKKKKADDSSGGSASKKAKGS